MPARGSLSRQPPAGEFVPSRRTVLVDFEPVNSRTQPTSRPRDFFSIDGAGEGSEVQLVSNVTRSGQGALQAILPKGSELSYRLPAPRDFSTYPLLSVAVYSVQRRGDFHVTLEDRQRQWRSGELPLESGWTDVQIDLGFLRGQGALDVQDIRALQFGFGERVSVSSPSASSASAEASEATSEPAAESVCEPSAESASQPASAPASEPASHPAGDTIVLDDIQLIDNRHEISPLPEGMRLIASGLDYELTLPGRADPLRLTQGRDGLWRLGADRAALALADDVNHFAAPQADTAPAENLEDLTMLGCGTGVSPVCNTAVPTMSDTPGAASVLPSLITSLGRDAQDTHGRDAHATNSQNSQSSRVGAVEVIEHNAIRLRLASTWFFPSFAGEWRLSTCRRVRWEYTFYWDGRWVTHMRVDLPGAERIPALRLALPDEAAWSDRQRSAGRLFAPSGGATKTCSFLTEPAGSPGGIVGEAYMDPPALRVLSPAGEAAAAPSTKGAFDASEGCYVLDGASGLVRFTLEGKAGGADCVVRLLRWPGPEAGINCDGLSIRNYVRLADGSLLFVIAQRSGSESVEAVVPAGLRQLSVGD